jgi:cytosine deaminase
MNQISSLSDNLDNHDFDLIIRNGWLEGNINLADIGVKEGIITNILPKIPIKGKNEIDAEGFLISPPFIDPHAHLDKCFIQPMPNKSGSLNEAIEIMHKHKNPILLRTFQERVDCALELSVKNGSLHVRTHVDIDPANTIKPLEAMLTAKQRWSNYVDLQIVAFPQEGIVKNPDILNYLRMAMKLGADGIGGIPAIEASLKDAQAHIDHIFNIASEFNKPVDMHIDETDDPNSQTLEMLANTTIKAGWQNRVSAAHCCSLAAQDDDYAEKVIQKVADAGITVITNPTANLVLQGRGDHQPVRRGITRVKELLAAGINVTCGNDNMRDSFYPFGQGDMLEVAFITALTAQLTGTAEIQTVADMPRRYAAKCLGYKNYGIVRGFPANLVIVPVKSILEALATRPPRRAVIRRGQVIFESWVEACGVDRLANNTSAG